ncbi:MAG: MFS transporter [Rhodoplanes sp.]|uniref:MFS transporter n=1 Tax=Rhodoplanes sp. TaxID=1968906 RepID=UPI0017C8F3F0|nr:MFS transporter [Rhodoplanes sp.]NVO16268.1 MFS transporter [Rhodoplanes sp.]
MSAHTNSLDSKSQRPSAGTALGYSAASIAFLVILCLAYSINAADRQIFPTLLPAIREHFGYDLKTAGLMSTIFTLGLAIAGIPSGYLVDRTSRKTIIITAMVIYSVFTLATVLAFGFWDMLFYRALTGVGEGMQMAALFAAIGSFFYKKRSFFMGWMILAYGVGAFLGPRAGAMLVQSSGAWQTPFVWFAGVGIVLALVVLVVVPKEFTESKGPQSTSAMDEAALAHMPTELWNRNVILAFVGCVILGFSLYGYLGLYTTYVKETLHFSQADAAAAFSYFGLGGLMSFVGGWFGDRFPQRWVTAIAFALLSLVGYTMYNVATTLPMQSMLSFLTGAFASGFVFVNLLTLLQRSVRPHMVGRASGIFLTSVFGAASTAGWLMGYLVGAFGWGGAALIELSLLPIIGIIAMAFIDPTKLIAVAKKA